MTCEFSPHEIEAMNLAADAEDDACNVHPDEALIRLMFRTYHGLGASPHTDLLAGMADVLAVVRAYDGARGLVE